MFDVFLKRCFEKILDNEKLMDCIRSALVIYIRRS